MEATNENEDCTGKIWGVPLMEVPQNGWLIMEHPINMDDLGVAPFQESSIEKWRLKEFELEEWWFHQQK